MILKTKKGGFAEIYADGLRFSLMKRVAPEVYEAYHGNTCCKDFFTDIFWGERAKQQTSIHGFKWAPGTISIEEPWYYMAMEHSDDLSGKAEPLRAFLNQFDRAFGFPATQVQAVGGKLLVAFSNRWTQRPVLISMITGLMRVGLIARAGDSVESVFTRLMKEGNPYGEYDRSEFGKAKVIPTIMASLGSGEPPHSKQTYAQYTNPFECHHSGGLIAFTTGRATG